MQWSGDDHIKYFEVVPYDHYTPPVSMIVCGSARRIYELKHYISLQTRLGEDYGTRDIRSLKDLIRAFLTNRAETTSLICQIYLAGWDMHTQAYKVYAIGDGMSMRVYSSAALGPSTCMFDAMGSGFEPALHCLSQLEYLNPAVYGQTIITEALMCATYNDVCTGGVLRVYCIGGGGPVDILVQNHCIDMHIQMAVELNDDIIYFFNNNRFLTMNYAILDQCLVLDGSLAPKDDTRNYPSCMGMVDKRWSMFIVSFDDVNAATRLFNRGERVGLFDNALRSITLACEGGIMHHFIMVKPNVVPSLLSQIHYKNLFGRYRNQILWR